MNYAEICIIKRDGKREDFSISKIKNALVKHSVQQVFRMSSSWWLTSL